MNEVAGIHASSMARRVLVSREAVERQFPTTVCCRFCRKPLHRVFDDWRDAEFLTWCSQDRRHEPEPTGWKSEDVTIPIRDTSEQIAASVESAKQWAERTFAKTQQVVMRDADGRKR